MGINNLPTPAKNMMWAGFFFMSTTWIQSQMVNLIILNKNRHLIDEFVSTPEVIPLEFRDIRLLYWEKMFFSIKNEFVSEFKEQLSEEDELYIERVYHLRNMLAHAQVSQGRDHLFYRPAGGDEKEKRFLEIMNIVPGPDSASPISIVLDFNNKGIFERTNYYIERVGVEIMERLATTLGIPHYQIC